MNHYITFYVSPNRLKEKYEVPIANPEAFLLSGGAKGKRNLHLLNNTNRITSVKPLTEENLSRSSYKTKIITEALVKKLIYFNKRMTDFMETHDKESEYYQFKMPKATGGYRTIDAPNDSLKILQKELQLFLEGPLMLICHNAAHAYSKQRSPKTNAEFHRQSNHFIKIDFSKFFPSITEKVLHTFLPQIGILAFSQYRTDPQLKKIFSEFVDNLIQIATLRGVLPQGTPLSPLLSNLIMIPFDVELTSRLRELEKPIIYTRYADDLALSTFYQLFQTKEETAEFIESLVEEIATDIYGYQTLRINKEKTTVSTKYGKNRITGVKVNAENKLSIGYKEKRMLKRNLHRLVCDKRNNTMDSTIKTEVVGYFNYFNSIEPEYAQYVKSELERKLGISGDLIKYLNS